MNLACRVSSFTAFAFLTVMCSRPGDRTSDRAEPARAVLPPPAQGAPPSVPAQPRRDSAALAPAEKTKPLWQSTTDWHVCLRQGAKLRDLCRPNDATCTNDVDGQIVDCYRAVYAHNVDIVGDRLELLGPRFAFDARNSVPEKDGSVSYRQAGDTKYLRPRRFAEEECKKALADLPQKSCLEEVLFGVERLVWMGGFGAGP
jgi:hypothetical protein